MDEKQSKVDITMQTTKTRSGTDDVALALQYCWDLPMLQTSPLVNLPQVRRMALEETEGLELAKALQNELISCSEHLTQRSPYPIDEIAAFLQEGKARFKYAELAALRAKIGVPLPRHIDLARYYAIRLVMKGVGREKIADLLDVDVRTVANYLAQAKERIRLVLRTRSIPQPADTYLEMLESR